MTRVSLDLGDGERMDIQIEGENLDEATIAALREVGEATLRRMRGVEKNSTPEPCEECGHVERTFYVCPACGVSFEVSSPTSARIFCGRCKRAGAASVRSRSGESLRTDGKTGTPRKRAGS